MKMTLGTLLEEGKEKLEKAGVPDPLLDARFLLLDVFDMNFASFLVKRDRPLTETENGANVTEADTDTRKKIDKYWELISKREMRIPLYESVTRRPLIGAMSRLHYNPGQWWTYFADIFAIALIIITLSGIIMLKGNKGIIGRGGIEMIVGIVIPILFLLFF